MTVHQGTLDGITDDPLTMRSPPARTTDPITSHVAAKMPFKRYTQRHQLLAAYGDSPKLGLTDEEAAVEAGIGRGCPWRRCGELREALLIAPTGETRMSSLGAPQQVCAITPKGLLVLDQMGEPKDG